MNTLKFVISESLTQTVNFVIGSAFLKVWSPLFLKVWVRCCLIKSASLPFNVHTFTTSLLY